MLIMLLGSAATIVWRQRRPRGAAMTERARPRHPRATPLRIVAALAALPDGDTLSFTRLRTCSGSPPATWIIQLRKLEEAGYLSSEKTRNRSTQKTTMALTRQGRKALDAYTG